MDSQIRITVLGAGQSIGKSCFLLSVDNQHILLDCGCNMGKDTKKSLPDFTKLPSDVKMNNIAAVLISHFHMDHMGGLMYLCENMHYNGKIYASYPTKTILPILFTTNGALLISHSQNQSSISAQTIGKVLKKMQSVALRETISINPNIRITPHLAGHVLGAVMWEIEINQKTILYTGDFSDDNGGFIPAYQLPSRFLQPGNLDMLIMECTYGNTRFSSFDERRSELVESVCKTIHNGGKVLIPCYGIGYTQEIIALLLKVWEERKIKVPIYYTSEETKSMMPLLSSYTSWVSRPITINPERIELFKSDYMKSSSPFVLFATQPTMIFGVAKTAFHEMAGDPKNLVILLGYNSPDSYASKIMKENACVDEPGSSPVQCQRKIIPFSAHPDKVAMSRLIEKTGPSCVVLIHGDKANCNGFAKYYSQKQKKAPFFLIPENGRTELFTSRLLHLNVKEREKERLLKREKSGEMPVALSEGKVKCAKSGEFLEMKESVLIPMSKEKYQSLPNDAGITRSYVEGKGARIVLTPATREASLYYISQISLKSNVC